MIYENDFFIYIFLGYVFLRYNFLVSFLMVKLNCINQKAFLIHQNNETDSI